MYSIDNIVTTSTCDKDGNLKLFSAFQMMQDCSEMWIESEPGVKTFTTAGLKTSGDCKSTAVQGKTPNGDIGL